MAALPGGTDVSVTHKFVSGKADGPDPTLVQPSKWNQNENLGAGADGQKIVRDAGQTDGGSWVNYDPASFTNSTGGTAAIGDVVAVSVAADNAVVLDDTVSSFKKFVVALQVPVNTAVGAYAYAGPVPGVKAQGAIAAGQYVRKSATTKAIEDAGVALGSAVAPPAGTIGFATSAAAAGFVNIFLFPATVAATATVLIGAYKSIGQKSTNNGATPTTKFDLIADQVVCRNPSDGSILVKSAPGTLTVDFGAAGPAALGRDVAGAFGASRFLHLYWIMKTDGTISATVSETAPLTGPALPAGYTHWAYAGAVRWNASSNIIPCYIVGAWTFYTAEQSVVSDGRSTTEATVSCSTFVPPNAQSFKLHGSHVDRSGTTQRVKIRFITTIEFRVIGPTLDVSATHSWELELPQVSQQFFYLFVADPTAGGGLYASVAGFKNPNGGE